MLVLLLAPQTAVNESASLFPEQVLLEQSSDCYNKHNNRSRCLGRACFLLFIIIRSFARPIKLFCSLLQFVFCSFKLIKMDNNELLLWLDSNDSLAFKVEEVVQVLNMSKSKL